MAILSLYPAETVGRWMSARFDLLLVFAHGSASSPFGTAIVAVLVPVTGAMVAAPVASTTSGPLG